jgi:CRISPR-associated endonuclease Csn1
MQPLPLELKVKIYNEKFFRKSVANFKFVEIREFIEKNGGKNWKLNYKKSLDETNVAACPVSARLKSVFGETWQEVLVKSGKTRKNRHGEDVEIEYNIEDIWHALYFYEDEEAFDDFTINNLHLSEEKQKDLKGIWNTFPIGYANLSLKAINNILPFLLEGIIYTEAVILGKIPEMIGHSLFNENKRYILDELNKLIENNRKGKETVMIVNALISKYKALDFKFAFKNTSYVIDQSDIKDINEAIEAHFGEKSWNSKTDEEKKSIIEKVKIEYQNIF